ncbi:leucine-rich repeat domain-containing protein [Sulfurovum sp.]|uniref:leucine-rich repeat domain-containing protein n=1 Tax=Sulfurovum sp. TaxID=1969726 RepID=UPI0025F48602|nr:leucine-rich repeat domain-containing protein [Sulfurovum sp.]
MYYSDSRIKVLYDWAEEHNLYLFRNEENLDEVLKVKSFEARGQENFEYIPEEFGILKNLGSITIYLMGLKSLPQSIGKLHKLQDFSCVYNKLNEIPDSITKCTNLEYLNVHINEIKELPKDLGDLRQLQVLRVDANLLERLPASIGKLQKLRYLDLSDNPIKELPETLKHCTSLKELNIQGTLITHIPEWLGDMKHLKDFKYGLSTYQKFQSSDNDNPIMPIVKIDNADTFKLYFEKELADDVYGAMKITFRKRFAIDLLDTGLKVKKPTMIGDEEWPLGTYVWVNDKYEGEYIEYYLQSRWSDSHGKIYKDGKHVSLQALWDMGPINDEYNKLSKELRKKGLIS